MRIIFPLLSLAVAFLAGSQARAPGAPVGIVLPGKPGPTEQFAAQELVKYIVAMGNAPPVVKAAPEEGDIYLGTIPEEMPAADRHTIEKSLEGTDSDSFVIRSTVNKLVIYGKSPRANLYGAYQYLESLGVRWYFPGRENEVVPRSPVKLDGYDRVYIPSFHKRGIVPFNTTPGLPDLIDYAAKVKLNTIAIHVYPTFDPFFDPGLAKVAAMIGPRGLTLDLEKHFFGNAFCPDDASALEQERGKLREYLPGLPPGMNDFFLWQHDGLLPRCRSPRYSDYSQSDLVLWFCNQILPTLQESRPKARIAFLSYLTTEPPATRVKPDPGVFLEWAPFNQSFGQAIDDPASAVNADYRRNFEGQTQLFGRGNAQILGYWLDEWVFYRGHSSTLPYNPTALKGDLEYYHRMGVPAITTMGPYGSRDYFLSRASPIMFLYPRLLWNLDTDPQEAVRDFCSRFFGSEQPLQVFDLLARADRMIYVERNKSTHSERATDPEFLTTVSRAMDIAVQFLKAQQDPVHRARAARLVQEASSRLITLEGPRVGDRIK